MKARTLALVGLVLFSAAGARAGECVGIKMPDRAAVEGKQLVLNGMGLREATILNVDVYVAGLYLEHRSNDGAKIASSEQTKQMRLTFVRDVSRAEMIENMENGFRGAAGADYKKLAPLFEKLKKVLPAPKSGDTFSITYQPGGGLDIRHGQKHLLRAAGADFARAIFLIWLGPKPPNKGLKAGLLGGRCG